MATFNNGDSGLSARTKINAVLQHADGTAGELVINENGGDVDFRVESDTLINALFVEGSTGNVGLGISLPTAELHVRATSDPEIRIDNGTALSQSRFSFYTGAALEGYVGFSANSGTLNIESGRSAGWGGSIAFTTDTFERMRIASTGNVGIGTTSTTSRLTVNSGSGTTVAQFTSTGVGAFLGLTNSGAATFIGSDVTGAFVVQTPGSAYSSKMIITSVGDVGIGTTTVRSTLHINSSYGGAPTNATGSPSNSVRIRSTATAAAGVGPSILFDGESGNATTPYGFAAIKGFKESANAENYAGTLAFYTQTTGGETLLTERMRLDASGNLGLGVTPSVWDRPAYQSTQNLALLGLANTSNLAQNAYFNGGWRYMTTAAAAVAQIGQGSFNWVIAPSGTAGNAITFTQAMTLDASGNLGIGVTNPGTRLHVQGNAFQNAVSRVSTGAGTTGNYKRLEFTDNAGAVVTGSVTSYGSAHGGGNDYALSFETVGTERMRIDAYGNVGIAVTPSAWGNQSAVLQLGFSGSIQSYKAGTGAEYMNVQSNAYNDNTNWRYIRDGAATRYEQFESAHLWHTSPSGTAGNAITFTQAMTLSAAGNLQVGTTGGLLNERIRADFAAGNTGITTSVASTAAQSHIAFYNGAVVGSIATTGSATAYNTSSDYRLKEDIQPVADATERLMELKPVNFAWKADGSRTDGFIAHEVQAVVPQAVTGEKDGDDMQQMDHSKLVPLLTAALQKAIQQIELLEARLDAANL